MEWSISQTELLKFVVFPCNCIRLLGSNKCKGNYVLYLCTCDKINCAYLTELETIILTCSVYHVGLNMYLHAILSVIQSVFTLLNCYEEY